jgi:hypothetical protein
MIVYSSFFARIAFLSVRALQILPSTKRENHCPLVPGFSSGETYSALSQYHATGMKLVACDVVMLTHHDRINRNDFSNPSFQVSFCIFRSGRVQARSSRIPDTTAMIVVCRDVHSIMVENRFMIEAAAAASVDALQRLESTSPPMALFSIERRSFSTIRYPKGTRL